MSVKSIPQAKINLARSTTTPVRTGFLQRQCSCGNLSGLVEDCADCSKKRLAVQRRPAGQIESSVTADVENVLRSPGKPLDLPTRTFMESRFGHDFSRVRVHTDASSAESANAVNAHAYTVGNDIVFAAGQFTPQSKAGLRLLAHELTHVIQQERHSNLQRDSLEIARADDRLEREADQTAEAIMHGQPLPAIDQADHMLFQRDPAPPTFGPPAPVALSKTQIQAAITYNKSRFTKPASIKMVRKHIGAAMSKNPTKVDKKFVEAVAQWQALNGLTPDGKVDHDTTRSIVQEMARKAKKVPGLLIDAVWLVIDSYKLPEHPALKTLTAGTGRRCCGKGGDSDAETLGGPRDPEAAFRKEPIKICLCTKRMLPKIFSDYIGFVRIIGHELVHVPQHQSGTGNEHVNEFEAWYWELCHQGRVPLLSNKRRVKLARIPWGHLHKIPPSLRTHDLWKKAVKLRNMVLRGGSGPC